MVFDLIYPSTIKKLKKEKEKKVVGLAKKNYKL
jgi:hypothetical protein